MRIWHKSRKYKSNNLARCLLTTENQDWHWNEKPMLFFSSFISCLTASAVSKAQSSRAHDTPGQKKEKSRLKAITNDSASLVWNGSLRPDHERAWAMRMRGPWTKKRTDRLRAEAARGRMWRMHAGQMLPVAGVHTTAPLHMIRRQSSWLRMKMAWSSYSFHWIAPDSPMVEDTSF